MPSQSTIIFVVILLVCIYGFYKSRFAAAPRAPPQPPQAVEGGEVKRLTAEVAATRAALKSVDSRLAEVEAAAARKLPKQPTDGKREEEGSTASVLFVSAPAQPPSRPNIEDITDEETS